MKILVVALSLCCLVAHGQDVSLTPSEQTAVRERIERAMAEVQTLQCHFTQTKRMHLLATEARAEGTLQYDKHGTLRWQYTTPSDFAFVMQDGCARLVVDGREQTLDARHERMIQRLTRLLQNSFEAGGLDDGRNFTVALSGTPEGNYVVTLTPQRRELRAMFNLIRMHFDNQKNLFTQVELIASHGDTTTITFEV